MTFIFHSSTPSPGWASYFVVLHSIICSPAQQTPRLPFSHLLAMLIVPTNNKLLNICEGKHTISDAQCNLGKCPSARGFQRSVASLMWDHSLSI